MKVEKYKDNISYKSKFAQKNWSFWSHIFFKPFTSNIFNFLRVFTLRVFGAEIGKGCIIYSSAYIPAPWKLKMGSYSCIGPNVKLHIAETTIGNKVTISQGSYICSGTHDISSVNKPFVGLPILINDYAWVAAEAFIGPGVIIGEGAVVGARSAVFKDVEPWTVVGGNPAKFIKVREIKSHE